MAPKAKPAAAKPAAAKPDASKKKEAKEKKEKKEERPEDLIPVVVPPKTEEFEARAQAISDQIDKLQAKQKDLSRQIGEATGGKDEYNAKRAELRAELDVWANKITELKTRKDAISGEFDKMKQEGQQARTQLDKMKKGLGYTTEAQIDERIASIEFQMLTGSLTLGVEKKLVQEIQDLKKSRPKVAGLKSMEANIGKDDGSKAAGLKTDRKSLGEEMGACIEAKKKVSEQLKALSEARKADMGDTGHLFSEREELSNKIKDLSGKRTEIRAEKREAEQAYRAYQAEVRKIRQERAQEERAAREVAYKETQKLRKAERLDNQPHVQEMSLIDQCIAFCKTFVKEDKKEEKEEKKQTVTAVMDGAELLQSKEDREDEYYFVPTAKAKKGKSKNKGTSDAAKNIKHNAETFQLFSQLKLDPPITTADIPDILAKLEEQLDGYKAKVAQWEKTREEQKAKILAGDDEEAEEEPKAEEKKEEEEKADE